MTRKKTIVPELLVLECMEEELSQTQAEVLKKAEREMLEFKLKFESLSQTKLPSPAPTVNNHSVTSANPASIVIQNQPSHNNIPNHNNIMVLEPNSGVHLMMNNVPTTVQSPGVIASKAPTIRLPASATNSARNPRILAHSRAASNTAANNQQRPTVLNNKYPVPTGQAAVNHGGLTKIQLKQLQPADAAAAHNYSRAAKAKSNDVVDLTDDGDVDGDQNEVSISKISEKTYPSLVVNVRVVLRAREISVATANNERSLLDARVKRVLMLSATNFTEWLLQQGLLKSEQFCTLHPGVNGRYNNLKLGVYTDVNKFPYSGGYVWISDCCPTTYVSVFSGSLFEGAPHPPTILLKLIYHWACQTLVQNVIQWVKVDNVYLKTMYTNLRAVCVAAVHEKFGKLGGPKVKVEVGVISLGTTSNEGSLKNIKVEVLGILERATKRIRLKALDPIHVNIGPGPLSDTEKQAKLKLKFTKILEPLQYWVDKDSIIVTDHTVDKETCHEMGFNHIEQRIDPADTATDTNQVIMDYLRKVIPKMFQNTLSLLTRNLIQQFLDELVWRENWGIIPSRAFDNIIQHISEQTRLDTGGALMHRLARIAANPSKDWSYDKWAFNCKVNSGSMNQGRDMLMNDGPEKIPPAQCMLLEKALINSGTIVSPAPTPPSPLANQNSSTQPLEAAMIALEPYYYGTLEGNKLTNEKYNFFFKCVMCKDDFRNVLKFTEHLISHAFNKNVRDNHETKELCKLCLKICPKTNNQNLNTHKMQVHNDRLTCRTLCKICSVKHKDAASLQSHMISTHCELDMPYHCEICNYRTSILDNIHLHFTTAHSKGTKGYCPYCLKVIQFAELNGTNLEKNQLRFVQHIQKHQLNVNKKCEKCLLNFTNRCILKVHQENWHQSCKKLDDVERFALDECTLMSAPLIDPLPSSTASIESSYKGTLKLGFKSTNQLCCECDGLITSDHFVGHLMCSKCRFQTCCNNSMKEHNALVHGTLFVHLRPPIIGRAPVFETPLYCLCGYNTRNGSYMASHLLDCTVINQSTCYITKRSLDEEKEENSELVISINDVTDKEDAEMILMTDKKAVDKGSSEKLLRFPPFSSSSSSSTSSSTASSSSSVILIPSSLCSPAKDTTDEVPHSSISLLQKLNSTVSNETKEENMKMAVDDDNDDAMECDDLIEDSMTIDDSSSEAMILD